MRVLHQKLHLQHHRHTGRLLHHKHTSYRGLAVVLVLAGSCMIAVTTLQRAAADSLIGIYGTVGIAPPGTPALITQPADNTVLTSSGTIVAGSCPIATPQAVIVLEVDSIVVGSAVCNDNNDFSMPLIVTAGAHIVTAQSYSLTGAAGPNSRPLHISYQPLPSAALPSINDMLLASSSSFTTLGADHTAVWSGTLTGSGLSTLVIHWGDDTQTTYTRRPGAQQFSHRYSALSSYNITLALTDSSGTYHRQQFAAAAYSPLASVTLLASTTIGSQRSAQASTTIGLYGLYVTLLSVCSIAWLHADQFAYADIRLPGHSRN